MQNLNILIIGSGVAGLTTALLLKKQGLTPTVIEKEEKHAFNRSGYMLGLLPLGGRVMNQLDLSYAYYENSVEMKTYEIHKENGDLIKSFELDFINDAYGSYRGIERQKLISLMLDQFGSGNIRFGTTATGFDQNADGVSVEFSDDTVKVFDLVISTDGMHSQTRQKLWDPGEYDYYDTNWGGWICWLDGTHLDSYKEYWGAASFLGIYPVKDRMGVFLGGPVQNIQEKGIKAFINAIQKDVKPEHKLLHIALEQLSKTDSPFFWKLHDYRTKSWVKGNIMLLGDAACGFLPTAGVGASMAMDSAASLVDELSRCDKKHLGYGLKLYMKRQKQKVETAQDDSRKLGKFMFVKSKLISEIRDYAMRYYSLEQMLHNLSKTIEGEN
ncbi:FAD-dependent oxidoreductase [Saccharicrinis sp. FJH54]|uniref:FAD-dependent oxidoreductase n=1 Tax=Saccharicrinis sp. FJH54 TaxID=3344665 RepID=UPI0035D4AA92